MNTKSINKSTEAFKRSLFHEADVLHAEAVENYELGFTTAADDFANRFDYILGLLSRMGWDKEYMGI